MLPFNCIEISTAGSEEFRTCCFILVLYLKPDLIGEDADDNIFDIEMQKAI